MLSARISSLDAMRGLLALGVMGYHLLAWTDTARVLTLGTYGVYAFFVLSGFALEWVYSQTLPEAGGTRRYGAARVARILPLYAGAALATALLAMVVGGSVNVGNLLLNVTLLFGFINPGATSTVVGGWSIGIEVVFYVLFPLIVLLRLSTRWLALLAVATLALRMAYVAAVVPPGPAFGDGWVAYSQMPSFLWFFLSGMVGARLVDERLRRKTADRPGIGQVWPFVVGVALMLVVVAASATDDTRAMFVGPLGLALSITVAGAVVIAGHAPPWSGARARVASLLGDISYGTYLLHPIVWGVLLAIGIRERRAAIVTIVAAPILAYVVHRWLEVPAGRAVKRTLAPRRRPDGPAAATTPAERPSGGPPVAAQPVLATGSGALRSSDPTDHQPGGR